MRSFLVAAALLATVSAQTFTSCNPMEKKCPADIGLNKKTYEIDFTKTQGRAAAKEWMTTSPGVTWSHAGAVFTIDKPNQGPTIQSKFYIHYGKVEFDVRASPGAGMVSACVLQSDDLDEIDWEWVGAATTAVQSNFYGKGNVTTYDRGATHPTNGNAMNNFYRYAVEWTPKKITWFINNKPVRTVPYNDPLAVYGKNFPQTPMNIRIGMWDGGDSKSQGTSDWAGGKPNWGEAPFTMEVKKVKVTNYNPAPGYAYKGKSGASKSIRKLAHKPKHHTFNTKRELIDAPVVERRAVEVTASETYVPISSTKVPVTYSGPVSSLPTTIPPYPTTTGHPTTYIPGTGFPGTGYTRPTSKPTGPTATTKTYTSGGSTYTSTKIPTGPSSSPTSAATTTPGNAAGAVHAQVGGVALGLLGALAML